MDIIATFPIQALHGFVYGMLFFLVASGLTLIFGMMGVLNFAHGALYMLGAYFSFTTLQLTGQFWLSLIIAPLLVGGIGVLMERFLLRRVHRYGHAHELLLTFGFAYIIEELVKWIWGNEPPHVEIPKGVRLILRSILLEFWANKSSGPQICDKTGHFVTCKYKGDLICSTFGY